MSRAAYLILENGTVFEGKAFGAEKETTGELVFTTAMTGYLETLTDPSYYGQVVIQTFPLIGNYGVIAGIVGSLTAAGGECEEHDGRQQEGGKGSELHDGGFLSCDEFDFFKNRGVLLSTPSAHSRCRQKTKP